MRKFATTGSVLVVLFAAAVAPAATAVDRADPPGACAGLVAQLADTLEKAVGAVTADPPTPGRAAAPLGDSLGLLTAMQGAKCLPVAPVSTPMSAAVQGPELCLSHAMASFAAVYGVLGKVVEGAVAPDPKKLRAEVSAVLKTLTGTLESCGLPAPPNGLPTVP